MCEFALLVGGEGRDSDDTQPHRGKKISLVLVVALLLVVLLLNHADEGDLRFQVGKRYLDIVRGFALRARVHLESGEYGIRNPRRQPGPFGE